MKQNITMLLPTEEVRNCPICNYKQSSIFEKANYHGIVLNNLICLRCGLVFLSPRLSNKILEKFYQNQYRILHCDNDKPTDSVLKMEMLRANHLTQLLQAWSGNNDKRVLEIGSSTGLLTKKLIARLAKEVIGIEPNDRYREFSKTPGSSVYRSLDELWKYKFDRFDIAILSHVLEHLPDPVNYLSKLKKNFLTNHSNLLVEVPNLYRHSCFELGHLISFSLRTLKYTLNSAGFEIIYTKIHSVSRPKTERNTHYITVFAKATNKNIIPRPIPYLLPIIDRLERNFGRSGSKHFYGYIYHTIRKYFDRHKV